MKTFKIGNTQIGANSKVYFIADIAANHDGSLLRAKKLIKLCAKAGANAAKFQHFKAETIVSAEGFKKVGKITHQSKWKKSVFDVYKDASINPYWTAQLKKECKKNNIDFLTAPYDLDYVDSVNKFISAYKIGSGDITWKEIIIKIAKKKFPQYNFFVDDITTSRKIFDKKFDIVIFNQILWYILEKLDRSFLNSHRILENNGYLIISQAFFKSEQNSFGERFNLEQNILLKVDE